MKKFMLFFVAVVLLLSYQKVRAGETPIECKAYMEGQVALLGGGPYDSIEWRILIWPNAKDTTTVFTHRLRKDCKIHGIYPDYERSEARFKVSITCDHETGMAKEVWVRPIVPAVKKVASQTLQATSGTKKVLMQTGTSAPNDDMIRHVVNNVRGILLISPDAPSIGQFLFAITDGTPKNIAVDGIVGEMTSMRIEGVSTFPELKGKMVSLSGWYVMLGEKHLFLELNGKVLFQ